MSAAVDVRRLAATAIAAAVTASCLAAPGLPEATGVLGVSPERLIAPEEPVEVLFSAPVLGPTARWTVVDGDGAPVPAEVVADGASWRLQPATVWPAGEVLRIEVDGDLVDEDGAPVAWPADGLLFEVAPARLPMTATIRWPTPGMPAPAGVRWIAVDGIADDRASIWLVADDHRFEARRQGTVAGLTRFALDAGPCEGLCPDATYALALSTAPVDEEGPDAGDDVRAGIRGRVVTATAVDHRSPRFEVAEVEVLPGWIEVRWSCDEPVRVVARLSGPGVDIEADIGLGRTGVWRAEPAFEAGQVYDFAVWAADLSERRSDGPERRIVGPAPVHVVLRELVTTPRSDWGDSEPRGVPFDASPGGGTVSSADEMAGARQRERRAHRHRSGRASGADHRSDPVRDPAQQRAGPSFWRWGRCVGVAPRRGVGRSASRGHDPGRPYG